MNPYSGVKRKSSSILRKLTASQVWRSIVFCVKVNITVLLIAFVIMICYVNYQAGKAVSLLGMAGEAPRTSQNSPYDAWGDIDVDAVRGMTLADMIRFRFGNGAPAYPPPILDNPAVFPGDEAAAILEQLMGFRLYTSDNLPHSISYPTHIGSALGFPGGAFGRLEIDLPTHFKYVVILPANDTARYTFLAFDMLPMAAVVLAGMGVLMAIQFFMILFGSIGIRRTTRNILRPISELAATARIINNASPTPVRQELKLDGAIDTLNAITEEHLDRRISIDDEREELKGLASAINAMLDRLDAAYQAQLRFVSDASHELRTPISVIQGYANLLDRWGKRDEKALQESIDAIKTEAHGMEGLVEQLLFLARSDNNSLALEMGEVDISALAEEIVKETAMIDESHKIIGKIDENLRVYGDSRLLKQAVRIFADNAIKYTPQGGRISISAKKDDGQVYLSVSDTGIGVAEGDLSQVFERFFRADASRARKTGGTGLGLAIAKYIIDRHGGHLDIISRENIGTKITAVLPVRGLASSSPPRIEVMEQAAGYQRPKAV
ncbi:MAG: HAMP domain-containing histidine kinase [Oscillospiraceae bacterium]|nr:HAMP domain-containing histidine kinase [Oscillospiraceae bacterium]